jgi:hypothetical protein
MSMGGVVQMKTAMSVMCLTVGLLVTLRSPAPAQAETARPAVDPKAEAVVRALGTRLKQIKSFSIEASDTIDDVLDTGQKVQYSHTRSITVTRPDKLVIKSSGDLMNNEVWKDGKTVTILDRDHSVYAQVKDPGSIDEMMDMLVDQFGVTVPLADLLSHDSAKVLLGKVETGTYVGLHQVDGQKCHHVAFTREDLDWEAWVTAGEEPRLRKLVITYKDLDSAPQYTLLIKTADVLESVPAKVFQFHPPEGFQKIRLLPLSRLQSETDTDGEKARMP